MPPTCPLRVRKGPGGLEFESRLGTTIGGLSITRRSRLLNLKWHPTKYKTTQELGILDKTHNFLLVFCIYGIPDITLYENSFNTLPPRNSKFAVLAILVVWHVIRCLRQMQMHLCMVISIRGRPHGHAFSVALVGEEKPTGGVGICTNTCPSHSSS